MARRKTPDFDKLDDIDVSIRSKPLTPAEEKAFSQLIKASKARQTHGRAAQSIPQQKKLKPISK